MRKALAVTHVPFEDLGTLAGELNHAGFIVEYLNACAADLNSVDMSTPDLLIVLGGPIGAYERTAYPFLTKEIELIATRLSEQRPTLGICLGAQLMAAALGAKVYPGQNGKEIGWSLLRPGKDSASYSPLTSFLNPTQPVLHWHGDTFDLPSNAMHLASSDKYANQAFSIGEFALGLQFHPEVTAPALEGWYVGHACELAQAKIDVAALRKDGQSYAPALEVAAKQFWRDYLQKVFDVDNRKFVA